MLGFKPLKEHVDKVIDKCGIPKCKKWYMEHHEEIREILDKYLDVLPLLFVSDMPECNNNTFAEIINQPAFNGICTHCSWHIVQSHNYSEEILYKRYFGSPCSITRKTLCYN